MAKEYAQALENMMGTEGASADTLVKNLVRHLREAGREKLLPGILRELKKLEARNAKKAPLLEVASKKEEDAALAALKKQGLTPEQVRINPSLIRGWRARGNGLLWDHSAKRALTEIYQKITH